MAELAPSILGAAVKAEQLNPLLAEACERQPPGPSRDKLDAVARSFRVLARLLREFADAFDQRDCIYQGGIKTCARQVLKDCNGICEELGDSLRLAAKDNAQGRHHAHAALRLDQDWERLQMAVDLQKAEISAIIAMASYAREVARESHSPESARKHQERVQQRKATVDDALAKAIQWDKMRLLLSNYEDPTSTLLPMSSLVDGTVINGEDPDAHLSPSFEVNDTLKSLLSCWKHVKNPQDEEAHDVFEDAPETIQQRTARSDAASVPPSTPETRLTNEALRMHNSLIEKEDSIDRLEAFRAENAYIPPPASDTVRPETRPHKGSRSGADRTREISPIRSEERTPPKSRADSSSNHPKRSKTTRKDTARSRVSSTRKGHSAERDGHMPPSPPLSAASGAEEDRSTRNVIHHHVYHVRHEHHHTESRAAESVKAAPQTEARASAPKPESVRSRPQSRPDKAEEFWNGLESNGGLHWEVRQRRGDRLLIKQFAGLSMRRQDETKWSHLTLIGNAWTSLPRRYCSRAILLDLPYEFKEDEHDFHISSELSYSQVREIVCCSFRLMRA